ncbi:tRNA (adenosine(37)-N6)-threonylcarbamoyltransferase complex ATPase subunit type 1 TsaE [Actinospongicola halichondriae]|uniref:tRNA (adenosine(37)-N6)-threonylcarbamoyltransferase complex ATPase subunit type 1 TsaE n=1 Tax=Actinospongicola halichondriae TaxID=3236844 RepID=UPI003D546B5A
MGLRARTDGVDATRALAAGVADLVGPGDVLLLAGELGAGKTAFTQGLGVALGIDEQITSPTFTLARHYEGRVALHHLDVYRLERLSEMQDVGVAELLDSGGVLVIEWGDAIATAMPADYLEVRFTYGEGDDDRELDFRCVGSRWSARERSLAEALEKWAVA